MAFHLDFDDAHNLITVSTNGGASPDSRLESLRALSLHPRFRNDYDILCRFPDDRDVPDAVECARLGLTLAAFFRGQKVALAVGEAESAMFEDGVALFNSTGRLKIGVFNNEHAAQDWLFSLSQQDSIAA